MRAYRKPSGKGGAGSGGRPTTGTGRAPPRLTSRRAAAPLWRAAPRAAREQRATRAASANYQNGAASATQRSGAASGGGTAPSALAPSRRQRRRKACQSGVAITDYPFGCGASMACSANPRGVPVLRVDARRLPAVPWHGGAVLELAKRLL